MGPILSVFNSQHGKSVYLILNMANLWIFTSRDWRHEQTRPVSRHCSVGRYGINKINNKVPEEGKADFKKVR